MNIKNEIDLTARYYGSKTITAIYKGVRLIWEAVNSCFGSGYWLSSKPWNKDDAWRHN
jgi:hypothetical protein